MLDFKTRGMSKAEDNANFSATPLSRLRSSWVIVMRCTNLASTVRNGLGKKQEFQLLLMQLLHSVVKMMSLIAFLNKMFRTKLLVAWEVYRAVDALFVPSSYIFTCFTVQL